MSIIEPHPVSGRRPLNRPSGRTSTIFLAALVASTLVVACGSNATTPASPGGPSGSAAAASSPEPTMDVFGNPVSASPATTADCPLAFAGWGPANADASKINVLVRLPGPVSVDITVSSTGRPDSEQNGAIAPGASSGTFTFDIPRDQVNQVVVHISDNVAADVQCYATSGD